MYSSLLSAVPYDTSMWQEWWASVMKTIGSASAVGFVVFGAITVIGVFRIVIRYWID